jgi:hypothetical protein
MKAFSVTRKSNEPLSPVYTISSDQLQLSWNELEYKESSRKDTFQAHRLQQKD